MLKSLTSAVLIAAALAGPATAMSLPTFADILPTIKFPAPDGGSLSTRGDTSGQ